MSNYFCEQHKKISPHKNILMYTTILTGFICVLVLIQFTFGALISSRLSDRSISQLIYQSLLAAYNDNSTAYIVTISELNNNDTATINKNIINDNNAVNDDTNHQEEQHYNRPLLLFAENIFWFQDKMTKHYSKELVLHSEKTKQTKRILVWNKDFSGGLR